MHGMAAPARLHHSVGRDLMLFQHVSFTRMNAGPSGFGTYTFPLTRARRAAFARLPALPFEPRTELVAAIQAVEHVPFG